MKNATLLAGDINQKLRQTWTTVMSPGWVSVFLACTAFAACYFRSFVFGNVPILFWQDQLGFATDGSRILLGQLPYRDFFEFLTPGTVLTYAFLFRIFGIKLWIPNLVMAFLGAGVATLVTLCASRVLRGSTIALPGLLFIGFVLYGSLDATHHWFSTTIILMAILVLLDGTTFSRVAVAGVLCGVAASYTQTNGATSVLAFIAYFLWQSRAMPSGACNGWRKCVLLCGVAATVFVAINAWFICAAGIRHWFDSVILFPLRYYPSVPINSWRGTWVDFQNHGNVLKWICFPFMYATVPLSYILFIKAMFRRSKSDHSEPWDKLVLLAFIGIGMFLAVVPALSIKRISSVSPPAMILLAWLLGRRWKPGTSLAWLLGTASLGLALVMAIRPQMRPKYSIQLPAGRAAIYDRSIYEVYLWAMDHTHPGQMYFGMPPMYLPLLLRNPTPIQAPAPSEYSRPEQIAAVIRGLENNHVQMLILRRSMYIPHLLGYSADHLQPFQEYLYRHYRLTKKFPTGDEIWERLAAPQQPPRVSPGQHARL